MSYWIAYRDLRKPQVFNAEPLLSDGDTATSLYRVADADDLLRQRVPREALTAIRNRAVVTRQDVRDCWPAVVALAVTPKKATSIRVRRRLTPGT